MVSKYMSTRKHLLIYIKDHLYSYILSINCFNSCQIHTWVGLVFAYHLHITWLYRPRNLCTTSNHTCTNQRQSVHWRGGAKYSDYFVCVHYISKLRNRNVRCYNLTQMVWITIRDNIIETCIVILLRKSNCMFEDNLHRSELFGDPNSSLNICSPECLPV